MMAISDIVRWRRMLPMDKLSIIVTSYHFQQKYWINTTMLNVHHSWDSYQKFIGNYLDSYESSNCWYFHGDYNSFAAWNVLYESLQSSMIYIAALYLFCVEINLKEFPMILMQSLDFYWQSIVSVELSRGTRMRCIWRIKWNHFVCCTLCSKAWNIFRKHQICSYRRWVKRVGSAVENYILQLM